MIETTRLLLRRPTESDIDAWTTILADPLVARYLGPPMDSHEAVATYIRTIVERHEADGFGLLAAERKDDRRVIGRAGFLVWDTRTWSPTTLREAGGDGEVEIGWTLARDCWGFGFATEAGEACRDYGFAQLSRARMASVIQSENSRSIAVARRLGMAFERDIRTRNGFDAQLWVVAKPTPEAR